MTDEDHHHDVWWKHLASCKHEPILDYTNMIDSLNMTLVSIPASSAWIWCSEMKASLIQRGKERARRTHPFPLHVCGGQI